MGFLEDIQGEVVAVDTAPLIYFIEQNAAYQQLLRPFFVGLDRGAFTAVTSTITLLETLVHPLRQGNQALAEQYRVLLLSSRHLDTYPVTVEIAVEAARLRATRQLKTPDAVQLATGLVSGARYFLTNDAQLRTIPDLTVFVLDDLVRQRGT